MKAWMLHKPNTSLVLEEKVLPPLKEREIFVKVEACGVCRTDLHILAGELLCPNYPITLGHQIVGVVQKVGKGVSSFKVGDRVGAGWVGFCCGSCPYCLRGEENICDKILFNGYNYSGGFAEECILNEEFCFPLSKEKNATKLAPLLCAGLIGYRAYKKALLAKRIGFYGFGQAAHLLTQLALAEGKEIVAFTREGDFKKQQFARECGAKEAYGSSTIPKELLDSAIIFAPVGALVPKALQSVRKGGKVILAGIHMSAIPSFSYDLLWNERSLLSVANLTREDGKKYLEIAQKVGVEPKITTYPFESLNEAIKDLQTGKVNGSLVICF